MREKMLNGRRSGADADYVRTPTGIVKSVYRCACHGREFDSKLAKKLHIQQVKKRLRTDFNALVQEGGLGQIRPWERLPGETPLQYNRFMSFLRTIDPKTQRPCVKLFAKVLGITPRAARLGANRWHWHIRYDLLQQDIDRQTLQLYTEDKRRSAFRQQKLGKKLQDLAMQGANAFASNPDRIDEMTGHEIAKLADFGVKIERLANSDPTAISEDRSIKFVWEGPQPDWAPKDHQDPALPQHIAPTIEGER